jgi:transposase-like protein
MSYQGRRRLGVRCYDCNVRLNSQNRGEHSPYWCKPCDKKRVDRISKQFEDIARDMGIDPKKV